VFTSGEIHGLLYSVGCTNYNPSVYTFRLQKSDLAYKRRVRDKSSDLSVEMQLFEGIGTALAYLDSEKFQRWLIGTQYNVDQNTVRVVIGNEF
jgi:hypothetical protein